MLLAVCNLLAGALEPPPPSAFGSAMVVCTIGGMVNVSGEGGEPGTASPDPCVFCLPFLHVGGALAVPGMAPPTPSTVMGQPLPQPAHRAMRGFRHLAYASRAPPSSVVA